ncbi:hypothetical protein V8B97DRAFT_1915953 [Scleroderma yunnanense]
MSNRPLQDDPNCYLQQIHSLNIHFATTPIKHFDEQEEHLLSKVSALDGAITLPTNGILSVLDVSNRVPPEGVGYVLMDSLFSRLFFMKEANRDDEDTHFYVEADARMGGGVTNWSHSIPVPITLINITIPRPRTMFHVRGAVT